MKNGFAIIVGKVIDMQEDSFTGRNGEEVSKLSVLVKPSPEAVPFECEMWGNASQQFCADNPTSGTYIFKCDLTSREWEKNGQTYRRTGITIREWSAFGESQPTQTLAEEVAENLPF
ncbi:MAG: hypothetical protein Unbinned4614contig1000_26 [Prokaryotic dsDNA virus sp.]|nr:MAG: hypothetical protein Unbinned4614contig1000_26 [Prokaryotic dsDNA virus sp.]|tara:strand:+ start:7660 stop:8010 length:351 start_codon:yes stop_codon:yes gene_type:complete